MLRREENYEIVRLDYARTNFEDLRKYFGSTDWREIMSGEIVQEKYKTFQRKSVKKYIQIYTSGTMLDVQKLKSVGHSLEETKAEK